MDMRRRTFMKIAGAAVTASGLGLPAKATAGNKDSFMRIREDLVKNRNQNRSTVACMNGIVCTSQPLASLAGIDMLRAGGSAIDAAVCANAMLSLVEPMNCGPGGDLFAILWSEKDQKLFGLNASGRAPYDWSLDAASALGLNEIPEYSPLAWSVPGCVSGWEALHGRFGKLSLSDVFGPVIRYAREGFPVSPIIASDWPFDGAAFPTLAEVFLPGGKAPRFGELFRNPDLAAFFETLVKDSPRAFYEGSIAERIVRFSEKIGGRFTMRDFANHSATWVEPASTTYRDHEVWEIPPNGQGIAALQILNMLDEFDIGSLEPNSAEHLHLFIEAKKLAYEDRAIYYADMDFETVPVEWLISKDYGRERAALIDPKKASTKVMPGKEPSGGDTIYLCAADTEGNMISLIQSTYHGWGSHLLPKGLGFPIQNRGQSFALDPKHRNRLEPYKRPFHTIIPGFLTKGGAPQLAFGVMGGDFQPQGHSQVLMNMLDFGMSPQQAGEQPRVEHGGSSTQTGRKMQGGGSVHFEHHFPDAVKDRLAAMGHEINPSIGAFGGYQSIWREEDPRRYFGGTDPRKDGAAAGY